MNDHHAGPVPRDLPDQQSGSTPLPDLWQHEEPRDDTDAPTPDDPTPTPDEPTD
ncbi:hypothetical protein [Actinacidiphila soli]|uniref:hypothetical protein n=1 Tax=Actinacidiphila soli TaxID=2487275 RepID=UPI0013E35E9D|nr:hypothetical protein [Actinacidiphila soli]